MSSGWPVSRTWRRAPMTGMFSLGKRTPRSMVYSKRISPASRSSMAMSTTWASKIAWILSPTSSYMAPISSLLARPSWTPLMIASSAARWSVSARRRFVSSNRRAFSRATPMLETIVVRIRSSRSSKASGRIDSSETTPMTSSPAMIGTPSHDSVDRPSDDRPGRIRLVAVTEEQRPPALR